MEEFETIHAGTAVCVQASDIDHYENYGLFFVATDITADVAAEYKAHFDEAKDDLKWWPKNVDGVRWLRSKGYIIPIVQQANLCIGSIYSHELKSEGFDDWQS